MRLWKTHNGYTLINHENKLFELIVYNSKIMSVIKGGTVGAGFTVQGRFLKNIPNFIKRKCFELNKKS